MTKLYKTRTEARLAAAKLYGHYCIVRAVELHENKAIQGYHLVPVRPALPGNTEQWQAALDEFVEEIQCMNKLAER